MLGCGSIPNLIGTEVGAEIDLFRVGSKSGRERPLVLGPTLRFCGARNTTPCEARQQCNVGFHIQNRFFLYPIIVVRRYSRAIHQFQAEQYSVLLILRISTEGKENGEQNNTILACAIDSGLLQWHCPHTDGIHPDFWNFRKT